MTSAPNGGPPPRRVRRVRRGVRHAILAGGSVALVIALFFTLLSRGPDAGAGLRRNFAQSFAVAGAAALAIGAVFQRGRRRPPPPEPEDAPDGRPDAGVALVLALALIGVFALLSMAALSFARARMREAEAVAREQRLRAVASDAAWRVLRRLADDPAAVDSTNEDWCAAIEGTAPSGIRFAARAEDEDRRFNLNNLGVAASADGRRPAEHIVHALLREAGIGDPAPWLEAMRDWIDTDDEGRRESAFYARRDPPRTCPNRPLSGWAEAAAADRWSRAALTNAIPAPDGRAPDALVGRLGIAPLPAGRPAPVNVNTAPIEVLRAVFGADAERAARQAVAMREAAPFASLAAVEALLGRDRAAVVLPWLDVRSTFFRVDAEAGQAGARARVRVLAKREIDGTVRVVQWTR